MSDEDEGQRHVWRVTEGEGVRLDAWIAARIEDVSRSQISRAAADGGLLVNGEAPAKVGVKVRIGWEISLTIKKSWDALPEPEAMDLEIAYEDDDLVVVNKPPGLVVHPAAAHPDGTLVNGLLHHFGAIKDAIDPVRPGIVHRLDRDTSGLLVVARSESIHRALGAQFADHSVTRRYLAVVLGPRIDDEGTIETLYGRSPRDRTRMTGKVSQGKRACTHWRTLARSETSALVCCQLETGRTHQIRVHMAESGHPVVSDEVYGRRPPSGGGPLGAELAVLRRMPRQALHAASLGFEHPTRGERLYFEAPPPDDMTPMMERLFGEGATAEAMEAINPERR